MKNRIFAVILVGILASVVTACGNHADTDNSSPNSEYSGVSENIDGDKNEIREDSPITEDDVRGHGDSNAEDFEYVGSEQITITKYTGSDPVIVIPEEIDSHKVVAVAGDFLGNDFLVKGVSIPSGVTKLENWTFSGQSSLQVVLAQSVESFKEMTFHGCTRLKVIDLGNHVTDLKSLLGSTGSLERIHIPASVTDGLWDGLFENPDVVIVGQIGSYAEQFANENGYTFEADGKTALETLAQTDEQATEEKRTEPDAINPAVINLNEKEWQDFFIITNDWGEKKEHIDGCYYTEEQPISLSDLNQYYPAFKYQDTEYQDINEIISLEDGIPSGEEAKVQLGYLDNDTVKYWSMKLVIKNYSENDLSLKECIQNHWWYLYDERDSDGHSMMHTICNIENPKSIMEEYQEPNGSYKPEYISYIMERFGKPDYYIGDLYWVSGVHENINGIKSILSGENIEPRIYFYAVYEYSDDTAVIYFDERLDKSGTRTLRAPAMLYYTNDSWEQEKLGWDMDTINQIFVIE